MRNQTILSTAGTAVFLLNFVGTIRPVHAEYYLCNVCQNSEYGERYLYDRSESFINPASGDRWTCGDLQDHMQDVNPTSSGAAGEAYLCTVYQIYAEKYCTCMGPSVTSLLDGHSTDINASCNLCSGYEMSYVPAYNSKRTIDTGDYGTQNCLGLYEAAMTGNVLNSEACDSIRSVYGECCSLPDLPDNMAPSGLPTRSSQVVATWSMSCPSVVAITITAAIGFIY